MAVINKIQMPNGTEYNLEDASAYHTGTFSGQANMNPTAAAILGNSQVRDVIITDTAPTAGSASPYPDGTIILVYE